MEFLGGLFAIAIILALICLTFLPTFIAAGKGHNVFLWALVNLLVFWTVVGWFVALFVAITRQPTEKGWGMKECVKCKSAIKKTASTCMHCGHTISDKVNKYGVS